MATIERAHRKHLTLTALVALVLLLGAAVGGRLTLTDASPVSPVGRAPHPAAGTERTLPAAPPAMHSTFMPTPDTAVEPQRIHADWEINAMTARHPEP